MIELLCRERFTWADELPRENSAGHGIAVDIDALRYTAWKRPIVKGSRLVVLD